MNLNGKSWITALIGFLGAAAIAGYAALTSGLTVHDAILAAIVAGIGWFAKDKNVTGTGDTATTQK